MSLADQIPDGAAVLVDTNPIIYVLEGHARAARFRSIFEAIDTGRIHGVVTPITIAEIVSGPLKAGNDALAERYRHTLSQSPSWTVRDIDTDIAVLAARLRLRHKLKLPDAIQLATAIHESCYALVTHDRDFASVTELPVLA